MDNTGINTLIQASMNQFKHKHTTKKKAMQMQTISCTIEPANIVPVALNSDAYEDKRIRTSPENMQKGTSQPQPQYADRLYTHKDSSHD